MVNVCMSWVVDLTARMFKFVLVGVASHLTVEMAGNTRIRWKNRDFFTV